MSRLGDMDEGTKDRRVEPAFLRKLVESTYIRMAVTGCCR